MPKTNLSDKYYKTIHPLKLKDPNHKSPELPPNVKNVTWETNYTQELEDERKSKKTTDDNNEIFKSSLFVLIFLFVFLKFDVYKFMNIKKIVNNYILPYLEHFNMMDIYSICIMIILLFPNFVFKLIDKMVVYGLKCILFIEFIMSFLNSIKN
jgi:hypothetical protein